ncbi:hypothetical protein [Runella sp. SP2]|nr:hypothetical protein [Runella sp. SP2]
MQAYEYTDNKAFMPEKKIFILTLIFNFFSKLETIGEKNALRKEH